MNPSADFIKAHLAQFGLCGSNNVVPGSSSPSDRREPTSGHTLGGHFVWGFGPQSFNGRTAGAQKYSTAYGRPGRARQAFREELVRAAREIHDLFGPVSVTA